MSALRCATRLDRARTDAAVRQLLEADDLGDDKRRAFSAALETETKAP